VKIGVIGLGKLGLPLAATFCKKFKICGVDISEERIRQILRRDKFFEPKLNEYLDKYGENLEVSTDYTILKGCDIVFIITQTPSLPSGKFDLKYVESALRNLHKVNPKCLAVVSSTINIGDMDKLSNIHGRICYNPEFIRQGSIIPDFEKPKFILIGAYNKEDGELVANVWRQVLEKQVPIHIVRPTEAEIIKLSLNVSFTWGIIFADMIGELCERFNADPNRVLNIIYQDRRNYMPGLGYAGPCFPRDVKCFRAICVERRVFMGLQFSQLLIEMNNYVVEKYVNKIKSFKKKKIGIVGVAYKPNVPYVYESQPLEIAQRLLKEGYEVYIYDPLAEDEARKVFKSSNVKFCKTLGECIDKADVIFIGTANYSNIKINKPKINPWM